MTAWLMQGNPDYYDFDGYLVPGKVVDWFVPQRARSLPVIGDDVWVLLARGSTRAGPPARLAAHGTIVAEVSERPVGEPDRVRGRKLAGTDRRVDARLDSVRYLLEDGALLLGDLEQDPVLSTARFVTFRQTTLYRVTHDEAARLEDLWAGRRLGTR
jgi:hypothetical protein